MRMENFEVYIDDGTVVLAQSDDERKFNYIRLTPEQVALAMEWVSQAASKLRGQEDDSAR